MDYPPYATNNWTTPRIPAIFGLPTVFLQYLDYPPYSCNIWTTHRIPAIFGVPTVFLQYLEYPTFLHDYIGEQVPNSTLLAATNGKKKQEENYNHHAF
jgi:hypothetical protein